MGFNNNSVKVEKKQKVVYVKQGRVLFFFLGMLFGIIVFLGALAGVGYWAYKNINLSTFGIVIPDVDETAEKSINKMTVSQLVEEIQRINNNKNVLTIAELKVYGLDLAKILGFPIADKFLNYPVMTLFSEGGFDKLLEETTLGDFLFSLDTKDMFDEPTYNQISTVAMSKLVKFDLNEIFAGVKIGGLMKMTYNSSTGSYENKDAVMQAFGNAYLTDLISKDGIKLDKLLSGVKFASLMGYEKDANGDWMKDGAKLTGAFAAVADKDISGIMNEPDSLLKGVKLGDVVEMGDSSPAILKALKDVVIDDLSTEINNITLGDALDITDKNSAILKSLKDTKISEMSTAIDDMKFKDIFPSAGATGLMYALQDKKINDLQSDIDGIYLGYAMNFHYGKTDVDGFINMNPADDILGEGKWYKENSGNYTEVDALNKKLASKKIDEFGTIMDNLTIGDTGMDVSKGAFSLIKIPKDKPFWLDSMSDIEWLALDNEAYTKLIPVGEISGEMNKAVDEATMGELIKNDMLNMNQADIDKLDKYFSASVWQGYTTAQLLTALINFLPAPSP